MAISCFTPCLRANISTSMHAFGLILQQSDVLKWVSVLVKEQVTKGFLLLSYRLPKYGSNIVLCDLEAILGLNCDTCIVV